MKYDEKTGKQIPENRSDEIKLSIAALEGQRKKAGGLMDPQIEQCIMLNDISVSLALLVDMCGMMLNILCKGREGQNDGKDG